MALRDRQISGIPLEKPQAALVALLMTACVPALGYLFWYPMLHVPEELRMPLAMIGMAVHLGLSAGVVPTGHERAQLWFGSPTGVSFPNGIYLNPRLPFPIVMGTLRILCNDDVYQKIFWSVMGDVRVESIRVQGNVDGMTKTGARVRILWTLVLEIVNVAVFRSQTRDGTDTQALLEIINAEFASQVKSSVISQHSTADLMRGYHAGGAQALNEWMTEAFRLMKDFGVELARSPITTVQILSEAVEHAFDLEQGKETFVAAAGTVGDAVAELKRKHPDLTETELAVIYPSVFRGAGSVGVNVHNVNFKK